MTRFLGQDHRCDVFAVVYGLVNCCVRVIVCAPGVLPTSQLFSASRASVFPESVRYLPCAGYRYLFILTGEYALGTIAWVQTLNRRQEK